MPKKAPHPVDRHVGRQLKTRRLLLGMSRADLGHALGITGPQVHYYENGHTRVGAGRLLHLSQILKVPVEYFFDGAPDSLAAKAKVRRELGEPRI
jgi:transcriptional regulator with XRE-family HTH domain